MAEPTTVAEPTAVPARDSLRRTLCLLASVVFVAVAVGTPMRASYGARTTGDEPHYLLTALSLAEDLDLDIADERRDVRYLPFSESPPLIQAEIGPDGRQVEPHDPLLPLVLAPAMAVGGWVLAKLVLAAIAAALAAITAALAVRRLGVSVRVAAWTAGIAGASPPLSIYGTQVYPEIAAALCVATGLWAVTGEASRRSTALAAACVLALPWLSVKYAPVAAVLTVAALVRCLRDGSAGRWSAAALLAGLGIGGVLFLLAHRAWYGGWTAYASGSHFTGGELTVMGDPDYAGRARRITGLLVDRQFGLIPWQPAAVALVPAVAAWIRRRPPGFAVTLTVLAAGWSTATFVALTMHGWWWPGRQVVVVLPAAVLVVAWWAERAGRTIRRVLFGLGLLGVLAHLALVIGVLAGRHTLIVDFDATIDPVVRAIRPLLPDLRRPGAATSLLHAAWVVAFAGGGWWAWRREATHP